MSALTKMAEFYDWAEFDLLAVSWLSVRLVITHCSVWALELWMGDGRWVRFPRDSLFFVEVRAVRLKRNHVWLQSIFYWLLELLLQLRDRWSSKTGNYWFRQAEAALHFDDCTFTCCESTSQLALRMMNYKKRKKIEWISPMWNVEC